MNSQSVSVQRVPNAQRGAVLFVSLIMLVVLALIGIAGMQVTTLQERMSGNYYNIGKAFENSEWGVRTVENSIQATVNGGGRYVATDEACLDLDMDNWSANKTAVTSYVTYTARIDRCIPGQASIKYGQPLNEDTTSIYQVTSVNSDTDAANKAKSVSMVAVETVYIP